MEAASVPHEITHGPSFAMLRVDLPPNTEVVTEAGSMVARHSHVKMDVKLNAGSASGFFAKFKAYGYFSLLFSTSMSSVWAILFRATTTTSKSVHRS